MSRIEDLEPSAYRIPPTARAINAVWFVSLTLALAVSLLAILVKQWLVEYNARMRKPASSARVWARRHAEYRAGLETWRVGAFISGLSFLLHVALLLFLIGLVGMLFELDLVIFSVVLGLASIVVLIYSAATFLPLWYGTCPSYTPLLGQVWQTFFALRRALSALLLQLRLYTWTLYFLGTDRPAYESALVLENRAEEKDVNILSWMVTNLQQAEDISVALQAIGSVAVVDYDNIYPRHPGSLDRSRVSFAQYTQFLKVPLDRLLHQHTADIAHLFHGSFVVNRGFHRNFLWYTHSSFPLLLQVPTYDISLLARLSASIIADHLPQVDGLAFPVLPLAELGEQLDRWLITHPGQLVARVPTLRQLMDAPRLRQAAAKTPSAVYWDIAILTGLQIAGAITPGQSPETNLSFDFAHTLAQEITEPSRPAIPINSHAIVHMLAAWSIALELQADLNVSQSRLLQIARSFVALCELNVAVMATVEQEYAITVFAPLRNNFHICSSHLMDQLWTPAAQRGALQFLRTTMVLFYRERFTTTSIQAYGIVVFKLADWQARHMHIASESNLELSELIPMSQARLEYGHFYLEDCIRSNGSSTSTFRPPAIVFLDRHQRTDGTFSSFWALFAAAGGSQSAIHHTVRQLAIELYIMSALGLDFIALAEEFIAVDLLPIILADPGEFGRLVASHLRRCMPTWWERARSVIAGTPADAWPDGDSSAQFIADVEAAQSCKECLEVLKTARKHGLKLATQAARTWDVLVQTVLRPFRALKSERSPDIELQAGTSESDG